MDEVIDLDEELYYQSGDVYKDKENIRKRRCSINRCLASKSQVLSTCITDSIEKIALDTKPPSENVDQILNETSTSCDSILIPDDSKNIDNSDKINFYENRENVLKGELSEWIKLCKRRRQQHKEAKERYKEALRKETVIDEMQMKRLTKEQKEFLLAKPDYFLYLQAVRESEFNFSTTMEQVKQTTNLIEKFLCLLEISNDAKYSLFEKEFSEEIEKSNKEIIRQMTAQKADDTLQECDV